MQPSSVRHRIEKNITRVPFSGCWLWEKSVGSHGYGQMMFRDKQPRLVHRVAYEEYVGQIPMGLHVLHRCDIRSCCNPHHLFVGTPTDNMQDSIKKGRFSMPPKGMVFKLTPEQRSEVKRRRLAGEATATLAREYGVHPSRVLQLARGLP